jgi:hypothetical protein
MGTTSIGWDDSGPLLGIFFGVSTFLTILFMNRVQGKTYRIQDYLASRKWHLFKDESTIASINKYLVFSCWVFFSLPPITLVFWGAGMIARYDEWNRNVTAGVAVFLVGFAALFFLFGAFKIKWNRYRMSKISGVSLLISVVLLTAYQIAVVFMEDDDSFFGLSAIFLTANTIIMIVIVFMNSERTGTSIGEIVAQLPGGEELDIRREVDYDDEITEAYKDDDYMPTQNEIFEMYTVSKASRRRNLLGVFEGGLIKIFVGINPRMKFILSVILYLIALSILGIYALLDYLVRDDSKLGIITACAVVATDVLLYLFGCSIIATSAGEISLHLVLFRICLFVLGGNYWIYGYSLLYLYFGSYLVYNIAVVRFPFMDEIIEKEIEDDEDEKKRNRMDIASTPEFIFMLSTALFAILLAVMKATEPDGVPLTKYAIDQENFEFWVYGVFSVLIVFIVFFAILVYRIFRRKRNGIDSKVHMYVHYKSIDLFWFFLFMLYCLVCIVSICCFWVTDDHRYLIVGLLAPLSMALLLNAYLKFALNDFNYLQDITSINKMIDKHNKKIDEVRAHIKSFKAERASQTGTDVKKMTLTKEDLTELAKKKMEYKPKNTEGDNRLESVEDEEEKAKPKRGIDPEDEPEDEEYEEDGEIEEGGEEEEKKHDRSNTTNKLLFKKKTQFAKNMFGRAAEMMLGNDEINFDDDHTGATKASKKFKRIRNWKDETNAFCAFLTGKLRPNDYHVYLSLIFAYLIICIMGGIICADRESSEGVSWAAGFLVFFICFGSLTRPFQCDCGLSPFEITSYVLGLLSFFAWGLIDFAIRFDFDAGSDDETGKYFFIWYCMFIPFSILITTSLYKWYDKKFYFDQFVIITMCISLVWGIALIICCYVFLGAVSGSIFAGLCAGIIYTSVVVYIYFKKGGFLPLGWTIANGVVLLLVSISVFIIALSVDDFDDFIGWSISYGIITLLIFLYGFSNLARDLYRAEDEPIYFSPWVFPVFKYSIKKNDVQLRNTPVALVLFSMLMALCWSFQCTVWIRPITTGIAVSCLVEVLFIISVMYLISFTSVMLEDVRPGIDQHLAKRSWLEAKNDYVEQKNIQTPNSMVTFMEIADKRDQIVNHMKKLKSDPEYAKDVRVDYSWNTKGIDPRSIHSCRKFLYEVELEKTSIFLDEVSLIVQFELLLIMHSNNRIQNDRKVLFKFLDSKKHALAAAEININIPAKGKPKYKHAKILTQISRLPAEKQIIFKELKEVFVEEEREREEAILEQERLEEEKEKERQERLAQLTEDKRNKLKDLDPNMPIDDMPDCDIKYEKIVKRYKEENIQFEDKQFPPNDQSLGPGCLNRGVAKWMRASEIEGTCLYREKIDARDVVQGALGDCYFLSAMSVLGDENVKNCIKYLDESDEQEAKCGAFWVRFYKYGEIEDIIIDDFFPVLGNGEFAFARGGPDGKELWPMILEKAYAKLNGSYNYIEAGKVQMALADMTGGVSEQIELRTIAGSQSQFWEKLKSLLAQGALMGAGSPEHAMGDRAINEYGIVQGHAYAVLGICEFDDYKLINLRNPHGNRGVEWNGDWSDDSDMWTQRAKSKCEYSDEADGIFWMDLDDFIDNYSYLYVCRIMKEWESHEIEDEWKGDSAEGLPSKDNRNAKLHLNPNFELKIQKPGPVFIQMTQFDKVNMFKGKHFIMFFVQNTGGGKIMRMDRKAILGMSGKPTNLNIISNEIMLTNKQSFPLTVTLLVANTKHGAEGEGKFEVKVFCMSKFTMKKL